MKKSAGILLYRNIKSSTELFLVHPGGPFWKNKDLAAWSVPKGEFADDEEPLQAAIREFREETGIEVSGDFINLGTARQKSGKEISVFALNKDVDASLVKSNLFEMVWPPKSGKTAFFPEVDKGQWFDATAAIVKINAGQVVFIQRLLEMLNRTDNVEQRAPVP